MKPASFYVLAEWRLRRNAIGSFVSREEAEQYLALMPEPRGWHVVPVEQPALPVSMLAARLDRAGFYAGSGPFEDLPPVEEADR